MQPNELYHYGAAMVSNLLWPVRYKLETSQNIVRKATEKKGR